ncbi:unnamed protein product [Ceutorhynchus assimilis]|uniref:Uncharacterized protein n=1 Tax=Ceutorhynchus assimilis TaxID=467358 RepID=A0A9N9QQK9_9CUCU|nr:unnamed protein product [Ceutorhynchus assimilis]
MVQYLTALSHIILAGTGLYCFKSVDDMFCKFAYGIITFHSLLGIWRWGNPSYGHKIDTHYRLTSKLQDFLVLPGIVTTIWLKYNYFPNLAYSHNVIALVPLLLYLYEKRNNEPLEDLFLGGNLLSLLLVSTMNSNYYGITASLSFVLSYFVIKREVINILSIDVPIHDLFNYSMCFFVLFARNAILDPVAFV